MPHSPGSPEAWMQYAHSDLQLAHSGIHPGVLFEALCFHAQQAVEKALKALLIAVQVPFQKTHNIEYLIGLLPPAIAQPPVLVDATILTTYAVMLRYPGEESPVDEDEYRRALEIADAVVQWADAMIREMATDEQKKRMTQ